MHICFGIDYLGAYVYASARTLHAAFYHVGHAERLGDVAQVALSTTFVLHHRCAADDFEVGNPSEVGKNLILYTISEISVLFIVAQVLERQHGDALLDNGRAGLWFQVQASCPWVPEPISSESQHCDD